MKFEVYVGRQYGKLVLKPHCRASKDFVKSLGKKVITAQMAQALAASGAVITHVMDPEDTEMFNSLVYATQLKKTEKEASERSELPMLPDGIIAKTNGKPSDEALPLALLGNEFFSKDVVNFNYWDEPEQQAFFKKYSINKEIAMKLKIKAMT